MVGLAVSVWIPYINTPLCDLQPRQIVSEKHFHNETVELDGKAFQWCTFTNTKLMYHGKAAVTFLDCHLNGSTMLETDNKGIRTYMKISDTLDNIPGLRLNGTGDINLENGTEHLNPAPHGGQKK